MNLSFVIPVYNESENIEPLIAEIRAAAVGSQSFEIIYVDDGSTDDTLRCLSELRCRFPFLRVIRHQSRYGQSSALWTGVKAARAPWIVTLDGDGQNDPRDVPRLLSVLHGADPSSRVELVAGIRARRRDRWLKRLSSKIANGVRRAILRDGISDTGCGLKLINRKAFLELPFFDHMHRFLPALILRGGGCVVTVEVSHRPRTRGRSKYGVGNRLWVGIVDLLGVLWLQRRMKTPLSQEIEKEVPCEH